MPIRRIKRFVADTLRVRQSTRSLAGGGERQTRRRGGSGPAGITAAWHLGLRGYKVNVFEAAPVAGGALGLTIPNYRLPADVVAQDVANLTAIGVEIEVDHRVEDIEALRRDGFDAVLVATGTPRAARLGVEGEDLAGVVPFSPSCRRASSARPGT